METPLPGQLREAWSLMNQRRLPWLNATRIAAAIYLQRTCLFVFCLALACGIIRTIVLGDEEGTWVETAVLQPFYVALPLLPVTLPFIWVASNLSVSSENGYRRSDQR